MAKPPSANCVQELKLTKDDVAEDALIPLKYVKFQNVVSLTVFVKDNQGKMHTITITGLRIWNLFVRKTDSLPPQVARRRVL